MRWKTRASFGLLRVHELPTHVVREYDDRLAIWRRDGSPQTWSELQAVKEALWPGVYALEVYPPADEVVDLRNTRHLWRAPDGVVFRHPEFEAKP